MSEHAAGVHLQRTDENVDEIAALAAALDGRAGLDTVLGDLNRRGRRSWAPGLAVRKAFTWDRADRCTPRWWPQGVSTSADADDSEVVGGRRMLAATWYAKDKVHDPLDAGVGVRVTFADLDTRRYRHVLLVVPSLDADGRVSVRPLEIHAGGLVWCGRYLHIAATAKGLVTCQLDDIMRVPDGHDAEGLDFYGYRYVLPVRFSYEARTDDGHTKLRYSFLSLDRRSDPPQLVVGEYGRGSQTTRLAHFDLDPESMLLATGDDGLSRPLPVHEDGVVQSQGVVVVEGHYYLTTSHGPWVPGSVYVGEPGAYVRHRWAAPMGPEDLAYWPSTDELWSLSEHPGRRWVFAMPRRLLPGG